jgi:hypothetical protein
MARLGMVSGLRPAAASGGAGGAGAAVAAPAWAYAPGCRDVTMRERRGDETVVRHVHRCD